MEKISQQDLRTPDTFVRFFASAYEILMAHIGKLLTIVVVAIIVALGWVGVELYSENKEEKAQDMLFGAELKIRHMEEAAIAKIKPKKGEPPPDVAPDFDYAESKKLLADVIAKNPNSQAAVFAAHHLSTILDEEKKYDDEIATLSKVVSVARSPILKGLVQNKLAMAYQAKGDCSSAISQWEGVEKNAEVKFLHGQAMLNTGLCQENLKQFDKALQSYQKAELLGVADQSVNRAAKRYLRLLKQAPKT